MATNVLLKDVYAPRTKERFGDALAAGDFDGKNGIDLAVGMPGDTASYNGRLAAIYNFGTGLVAGSMRHWDSSAFGIMPKGYDKFGAFLAVGDFNGDGKDDLANGARSDIYGVKAAGAVFVRFGSINGLTSTGKQLFHEGVTGIAGDLGSEDDFGNALAAGDFNGDGKDDLAIGVNYDDIGLLQNAGSVRVLNGTASGLSATNSQYWQQGANGIKGVASIDDLFGSALVAADFNGDGKDDLAVSTPSDTVGSMPDAGSVNVVYGSARGLTSTNNQLWTQNSSGIHDQSETDDYFGASLTAGDFNGDGKDDLVIGSSRETINGIEETGAVNVIYGSSTGLASTNNQFFHEATAGLNSFLGSQDWFGASLGVGDFNRDGFDDLVVAAPYKDLYGKSNAGVIYVLKGSSTGLTTQGSLVLHQDVPGVQGDIQAGDYFGSSFSTGDFNRDGFADLAVGSGGETVYGLSQAGTVHLFFGSAGGLTI
jgi:hypothetical protein